MSGKVVGAFPAIRSDLVGGVQASGRLAWKAIQEIALQSGRTPELFIYDPSRRQANDLAVAVARSKSEAICKALARNWRPNVVLVWHLGLLKLVPFFRLSSSPLALFLHGIEAWQNLDFLSRQMLRRVNLFLSNSDFTWSRFLQFQPLLANKPHRTVYLGLGSPSARDDEAWPRSAAGDAHPPAALMLSRLARTEDYKGHRELIAAWGQVCHRMPGAQLWIAGDGDLRPELERRVAESNLQNSIRFFGRVSEEQKQELLGQSRCLAVPSRGEGFGLVYLEAMRIGRPCLVSDCDAGREVVNPPEAGLAVDPGDSQALTQAICRLLTPGEEWDNWSRNARSRYEQNFTAAHFQQRLITAMEPFFA